MPGASWVAPEADESKNPNTCCTGSDTYQTLFSLSGLNPGTASLTIDLAADDQATIYLNGVKEYQPANNQTLYPPGSDVLVNITSDFLAASNTLDFVVLNGVGPTGLDAAVSGTAAASKATAVPEPGTTDLLVGFGVLAGTLALRRKQVALARQTS